MKNKPGLSGNVNVKYPSYLTAYDKGVLELRLQNAVGLLESCVICPRKCRVNRLRGELGFCKTGTNPRIYSYMAHHGEEPPISGVNGSGAIFFSGCNMGCVYCQNYEFSQTAEKGREVDPEKLAGIMLKLQDMNCHNINLVTPTHVMPQILMALNLAIPKGLKIPLVYNTGGYDSLEMIKLLDGIVDIYLPDMRYCDNSAAMKYSCAADYSVYNRQTVKEMYRQAGEAVISEEGIMKKGIVIRHLVLPNDIAGTKKTMNFIAEGVSQNTYISLMSQYLPLYKACQFKELARRATQQEYELAQEIMHSYGLFNGWTQEAGGLDSFAGTNIKPMNEG